MNSDDTFNIYWYLTYKCNLQCRHCWISSSPDITTEKELSLNHIKNILNQIQEITPNSHVIFSGGEPLLRKDFLNIIYETNKRDIRLSIESNGLLINNDLINEINHINNKINFGISLDGGIAEHHDNIRGKGTFFKTIDKIMILKKYNTPFSIQCVINKENKDSISNLIDLCKELKPNYLTFAFLHPLGRALDNLDDLNLEREDFLFALDSILEYDVHQTDLKINIKTPPALIPPKYIFKFKTNSNIKLITNCDFPKIGITPNGNVTLCSLTKDKLFYGNLKEESLENIIEKNNFKKIRSDYYAANLNGICKECVFRQKCKGSCRSMAYYCFDSLNESHPFCMTLEENGDFPSIYKK
ncbi:radical SAM/SPASM domain-containing protein [Sporanaerobacter acetigenes]|uniref:radical SAM/SPASM domain-containing protein n=1 Tax=Sporanaerobacter acetigenes TaxID=165813 RepID=UPI00332B9A58